MEVGHERVHGKRYRQAAEGSIAERSTCPADAIKILKGFPDAKFDETVEIAFRLGVDPRKHDQMLRGTVSLPHGTGKSVRVAAFAEGEKAREARRPAPTWSAARSSWTRS